MCVHDKSNWFAQVRKSAQQAVKIVLKGSLFMTQPDPPPQHPAASLVAKFCVQVIESQGGNHSAYLHCCCQSKWKHTYGL